VMANEMQMIGAPSTIFSSHVSDDSPLESTSQDYMEFLDYQKSLQSRGGDMQPVALPDLAAPQSEEKKQEPKRAINWEAMFDSL